MPVRVGFLSAAHLHADSYVAALREIPDATIVGLWDDNSERARDFASRHSLQAFDSASELLAAADAVIITSENRKHADLVELACRAGKHVLCEKPLATTPGEAARILAAAEASSAKFMTAFPCRYSPAFMRLVERVRAGEIGQVKAVCATNRGKCPFSWFVDPELSGGGAMIDHVVHVADLLWVLLGEEPESVQAQIGNNMYGEQWEDTAMLTLQYASGIFATLDSSWSRPQSYRTWGDVSLNVVGEDGVIELDMFAQSVGVYSEGFRLSGFGSNIDLLMVKDFIRCIVKDAPSPVSVEDGLRASRVAMAGYESVTERLVTQ